MHVTNKFAILLTLFLTLGITSVSAAHTAQTSVDKQFVDDGSSDSYTFTVSNDGSSSNDIYKVVINSPSGFSISTSSCPTGWYKGDTTSSKLTCLTDPFGGNVISSGSSQEFTLEATSENPSSTTEYTWSITSTDSNGDKADSSAETTVDLDEPSSTASITSPANQEVTSGSSWTIEPTNVDDPTSSVEKVTIQYRKGSDWQDHNTKDYTESIQFTFDPSSEDGLYEFRTVAEDKVGNTEEPSGADTSLTYDTTEPDVTITSPSSKVYRQPEGSVTVDFDYVEENPEEATLEAGSESQSIDGLDSGDSSDSIDLGTLPGEEKYNLKVTLGDLAGQSGSDTANDQLVVDGTAPTLEKAVTGGSLDGESTDRDALTVEFTDALSGLDSGTVGTGDFQVGGSNGYTIEGKTVSGNTVTLDLDSDLPRGATPSVTLTGEIEDKAGNVLGDSANPSVDAEDGLSPQNPSEISFTQDSVNKDNDENIDVDVNFGSAPEAGDFTLRIDDSNSDGDALTFTKSASQTTTFSDKDLSDLDDGTLTATAKIVDDSDNTNSEGFTASEEIQKDTTDPVLQNAVRQSETEFKFEVHDEGNGLDASTVESEDFVLTAEGYSADSFNVKTCEDRDATCTVTVTLSDPIDQDTLTVGFDGSASLSDVEGNIQSEDTVQVSGMDSVAPTLDSATRDDDTTIEATVSDSGVGLDESTFEEGDFTLSTGSISGIQTNFQDEANTGKVTINLNSPVDSTSVEVSLRSDGVADMDSNIRTSESATADDMDGVPPTIDHQTIEGDTPLSDGDTVTVYATVNDDGAGVETVNADMSAFGASSDVTLTSEVAAETDFDSDGDENSDVYGATVTLDDSETTSGSQSATVTATDAAYEPSSADEETDTLEVDIDDPTVTSASIENSPISDSDTGDSQTVTVEFSEEMDTSDDPTVEITGIDQGPLTVISEGFDDAGDTWTGSVTINDNDEDTTATIDVSGAQDLAGNSLGAVNDNTFLVDTANPQKPSTVDFDVDYANIDNQASVPYTVDFEEAVEQGTVHVTATGSEGDSVTVDVSVSQGETSVTGNLDLSTLDEGQVDLSAYMTDQYGNDGQTASTTAAAEKDVTRPVDPSDAAAATINEDNVEDYSVDIEFGEVPEPGFLEVKIESSGEGASTRGQRLDPTSSEITIDQLSLDHLDQGEATISARYKDDADNFHSSSGDFKQLATVTKDTVKPELESAIASDRTTVIASFSDNLDASTVTASDFTVEGSSVSSASVSDSEGKSQVTLDLSQPIDTGATPEVGFSSEGSVQDVNGNQQTSGSVEAGDRIPPQVEEVRTYNDGESSETSGVKVIFSEELGTLGTDPFTVTSGESDMAHSASISGDTVNLDFTEEIDSTSVTPDVEITDGAVSDDTDNQFRGLVTVTAEDGVSPVLEKAEINQDLSSSSKTVLDLRFSETVSTSSASTAALEEQVGGELRFDAQTGQTVQATYYKDGQQAVLNTGSIYTDDDGGEAREPEIESFTGVTDVERFRDAGADFGDYSQSVDVESDSTAVVDKDGSGTHTYQSIQNAVDATPDQGYETILVRSGEYDSFNVDHPVDIIGASRPDQASRATVVVDSTTGRNGISSSGVTVKGLHFRLDDQLTSSALYINTDKTGTMGEKVTVESNYFEDTTSQPNSDTHAIKTEDAVTTKISDNAFIEGFYHGVQVTKYANQEVTITGNTFLGQSLDGVFVTATKMHEASVDIVNNRFAHIGTSAFLLTQDGADADVDLKKNHFESSNSNDLAAWDPANDFAQLKLISGNLDATGNYFGSDGIQVQGAVDASYAGLDAAESTRNVAVNSLGTDIKTFTRTLEEGSNMVSFPIRQGRKPVSEVIEDGSEEDGLSDSNVETVWTYQNGQWRELATGYGDSEEDYFRGGLGYIFHMTDSDTLSVNVNHEYQQEEDSTPESLELSSTWNLVGSYQEFDQSEDSALSSLDSDYEAFNDELNCVEYMETGVGYWVTRTDNNGHTPSCS